LPVLEVQESTEEGYASIIVEDDGSGISAEKVERINSCDYFTAWVTQSHGLGLIIARSIVEAHHGRLILKSEAGRGTQVTLRIPVNTEK
jgi:two-component system NtrC family sensor kinase